MDALLSEALGARARVLPVRIAAVDDHVSRRETRSEFGHHRIGDLRRDHHPCDARRSKLGQRIGDALRENRSLASQLPRDVRIAVRRDDFVPAAKQAQGHVVAHLAQTDHREAHGR